MKKVLHNPYMSDITVQSNTRGTAYTFQDASQTDENITIDQFAKIAPQFIDRADMAQSQYTNQMVLAERQGILLNEAIETAVYADNANFTDIGDNGTGAVTLSQTTQLSVSATNIDDIIRGVKREIHQSQRRKPSCLNATVVSSCGVPRIWKFWKPSCKPTASCRLTAP